MAKAKKFPAEIFVRRVCVRDYPSLVANESLDEGIDDGEKVAIYKLVSIKIFRVKFELTRSCDSSSS